jgi:hypothetical protein
MTKLSISIKKTVIAMVMGGVFTIAMNFFNGYSGAPLMFWAWSFLTGVVTVGVANLITHFTARWWQ